MSKFGFQMPSSISHQDSFTKTNFTNVTMRLTSILLGATIFLGGQSYQARIPTLAAPTTTATIHPTKAPTSTHTAQVEYYLHEPWDNPLPWEDLCPSFPSDYFKSPSPTASPSPGTEKTTKQDHPRRAINTAARTTITISRTTTRTISGTTSTGLGYEVPWNTKGQTTTCWTCWGNELCCDWYDAKTGHPMTFAG